MDKNGKKGTRVQRNNRKNEEKKVFRSKKHVKWRKMKRAENGKGKDNIGKRIEKKLKQDEQKRRKNMEKQKRTKVEKMGEKEKKETKKQGEKGETKKKGKEGKNTVLF